VSDWSPVFIGVIAVSTLIMAIVQIAVVVAVWLFARRMAQLVARIEQNMGTILSNLDSMSRDAARVGALAATQAERVDGLVRDLTSRIHQTAALIDDGVLRPLRDGAALLAGVRAAFTAVKGVLTRPDPSEKARDDEGSF
jgi:hypothetical protein